MKLSIEAPDSLREIDLSQYQEYESLEEPTEKDIIKIFLNLTDNIVNKIPYKEVERVKNIVLQLFKEEAEFKKFFVMDGIKYGFIPNLDEMAYEEYEDAIAYINDSKTLHKAMAVLYRPVIKTKKGRYLIEEYEGSAKYSRVMKNAPLDVVLGAKVFFFNLGNELLNHIPNYLKKELREAMYSSKNGEHITKYIQWLRGTLDDSILSPHNHSISA